VLADQVDPAIGVEVAHQHDRPAHEMGECRPGQWAGVVQRASVTQPAGDNTPRD